MSAASGGYSEPKQGAVVAECEGLLPRSTMRVPQPDIIEHFGNADAVPQPPERCLSRKAGIMRCCLIAIEHARNDKSLTREDLAERIRKSERYVVAIERGERTPSLKTCDTYVHSMDEHKRREMDKMDDMFGMQYSISVENQPYPVLCTLSADGCTAHVPDFPKIVITSSTLDTALLEIKQQIQKALRQYKNPPIPTKQDQIVVPTNSVLVLVKAS